MAFPKAKTPYWLRKILFFFWNLNPFTQGTRVPREDTQEYIDRKEKDHNVDSEIDGEG